MARLFRQFNTNNDVSACFCGFSPNYMLYIYGKDRIANTYVNFVISL